METKTIQANGAEFTYIEQGSGEPVIFVHGSQGDYRTWLPQMEACVKHFRAISYSRRYHYPNPWVGSGTDYNPGMHAADLAALVEALQLDSANIVGTSFGAYTTLIMAVRRPDLIKKMVICEPPILIWLKEIPGGQPYWDGFMKRTWLPATEAFQSGELEQGVRLFVDGVAGKVGAFEELPEAVRTRFMENAESLSAETRTPDYFTPLTAEQVAQIQTPTLLLKGEKSAPFFHLIVDRLAQLLPLCREAVIPNAGHSMASNNPEAFNKTVLAFLRGG